MSQELPKDIDPQETLKWLQAIESVLEVDGPERAHFLLEHLVERVRRLGVRLPFDATTAYINTIPTGKEQKSPGNHELEHRLRSYIRWNALAMVVAANKDGTKSLGGHIASFQSAATLYDVGFNHFWRAASKTQGADLIYIQGHSSPGIYARAFLEGRINEEQLRCFRQEVGGVGLSSYPHPWLMPDFWQFPTVSMGLGPLMAIYQARFMRYLSLRGLASMGDRKVWAFMGDGEMDEPESLGAIGLAAREGLDNLIFVVNCNLQRLDGPVRGNGKIIQELEGVFRGAGWHVIKVIWGGRWDQLLAMDHQGILKKRMEECVDGEYQTFKSKDGAYVREHFFGKYPELREMVATWSDRDIWELNRGGHDPHKVYAAYWEAVYGARGCPTVILAKTIKGYGMGASGQGQNIAHQQKKIGVDDLKHFRDRFAIPIEDEHLENLPFYRPPEDSPEMKYMRERREALHGYLPERKYARRALSVPSLEAFEVLLKDSGDREISTTMAFVRMLGILVKDANIGPNVVPIVPDESRTFGMEGMFRQLGIWSSLGQLYEPQDADQLMFYKEDKNGQILQEGINEAGAMSSWIAAGTSYANHDITTIPFYIFYSMFGFQRIGDLAWAAGDLRTRGFLLGGTSGRTTLNGEGLQHQDGHSHIQASLIPNCIAYDPSFAYEVAVIIQDGLRRMYVEQEDVFYYITLCNENYVQPALPQGVEAGLVKGMYLLREAMAGASNLSVQLLGSGSILRESIVAAEILEQDFNIGAYVWSVTSFSELQREGMTVARENLLHPEQEERIPYVTQCLARYSGSVVASTDYVRQYAEQIRAYVPGRYNVLGTDGFGRSDARAQLRDFFEIDRRYIVLAALKSLVDEGSLEKNILAEAIQKYELDVTRQAPWLA